MYVPLALQRRLALGLQVPLALLAVRGWWEVVRPRLRARRRGLATAVVVGFSTLTNLFLMAMLVLAALSGEPLFYLSDGEWQALEWLREEVDHNQVVLCAPQTGAFVPAWAGQRVVYGHVFETVNAERREAQVTAYWIGQMSSAEQASFLQENRVGYVLVGPREVQLATGDRSGRTEFQVTGMEDSLIFEAEDVRVYRVDKWK
jgi:hypothetical protein